MPAPRRAFSAGQERRPHDLLCGSIHSLPKGLCPKGRTDSGRSYRVKSEDLYYERKGPLRNQRPFLFSALGCFDGASIILYARFLSGRCATARTGFIQTPTVSYRPTNERGDRKSV